MPEIIIKPNMVNPETHHDLTGLTKAQKLSKLIDLGYVSRSVMPPEEMLKAEGYELLGLRTLDVETGHSSSQFSNLKDGAYLIRDFPESGMTMFASPNDKTVAVWERNQASSFFDFCRVRFNNVPGRQILEGIAFKRGDDDLVYIEKFGLVVKREGKSSWEAVQVSDDGKAYTAIVLEPVPAV